MAGIQCQIRVTGLLASLLIRVLTYRPTCKAQILNKLNDWIKNVSDSVRYITRISWLDRVLYETLGAVGRRATFVNLSFTRNAVKCGSTHGDHGLHN